MAKLSHPNVVHVYEVGRADEIVFIAMEYVAGQNLRQWTQTRSRRWDEVLDRHLEAGRGLAAAHRVGLVHRDYKPENVLVGADGRSRVVDFGLARPGNGPPTRIAEADTLPIDELPSPMDVSLTRTGQLVGTPAYMAPEHLRGERTDARSDQFAFCVALFEGLYGARPFSGRSMPELAAEVLRGDPRPVDPADHGVPAAIHAAILRGLSRAPDQRFESMEALLQALTPSPARPNRSRWLAAALVGAALVGTTRVPVGRVLRGLHGVDLAHHRYVNSNRTHRGAGHPPVSAGAPTRSSRWVS